MTMEKCKTFTDGLMSYLAFSAELEQTEKAFLLCFAQTGRAGANRVWEDKRVRG